MATMNDVNVRLLMHMLRMYTPNLAGTNWDQISAEMGQSKANLKQVTNTLVAFHIFPMLTYLVFLDLKLTIIELIERSLAS